MSNNTFRPIHSIAMVDEDAKMGNEIHDAVREATTEFDIVPVEFWSTMDWAIDMTNNNKYPVSIPSFVITARSTKNSVNFGKWLHVALCAIKSHVQKVSNYVDARNWPRGGRIQVDVEEKQSFQFFEMST